MRSALLPLLPAFTVLPGCINLPSAETLLPVGTPFVVRGTMTTGDELNPCPVWLGENGQAYYLYQDPLLDNQVFDRVTTPGTTSRLAIATRSDLGAPCSNAKAVEVQNVLEVVE